MSQWTHVNGSIRIDGIPGMMPEPDFGVIKTWEDGDFDEATVPCGSEGSLQYKTTVVGEGLVWLNTQIWGDLRDYDNVDEIIEWIESSTQNSMIRSGIIEIGVESSYTIILQYNIDTSKWEIK